MSTRVPFIMYRNLYPSLRDMSDIVPWDKLSYGNKENSLKYWPNGQIFPDWCAMVAHVQLNRLGG